ERESAVTAGIRWRLYVDGHGGAGVDAGRGHADGVGVGPGAHRCGVEEATGDRCRPGPAAAGVRRSTELGEEVDGRIAAAEGDVAGRSGIWCGHYAHAHHGHIGRARCATRHGVAVVPGVHRRRIEE